MPDAMPPLPDELDDESAESQVEDFDLEEAAPAGDGQAKQFPCKSCGADITFRPGTATLVCDHCGTPNPIPQSDGVVVEQDFYAILTDLKNRAPSEEHQVVGCESCGAHIDRPPHMEAFACPFCDSPIVAAPTSTRMLRPQSLLPFHVGRDQARQYFRNWVRSRWFAPSKLRQVAKLDATLRGVYMPYWTYDCNTITAYTGRRGEDYYVNERYTDSKGKRRTRRKRKTRWYYVRGTVFNTFDDLLVLGSRSLPREHAEQLEPWDLSNLTPYQEEYLSGFEAETYQVDLEEGWSDAQQKMIEPIRQTICRDIGGDRQRISTMQSQYNNIRFKHLLLPVWISAYRYKAKLFRIIVNARTGEVQGERPYSWVKITLAVIAAMFVFGLFYLGLMVGAR